ncbi:hypothetical protein AVEN_210972-1 [Araneus ventricosus]|uniref:Uncharacterized protein n=1 Tax=Araneus ventricosus TaxID=182803 RepID=A0A4Y2R9L4_ARAVE|nr:hypothetical protein AVEN_227416-1 [Araneus ventricosus]GBN72488.1 hypothetical protein AVEN_210972-1 [Araneus ventricosus]
MNFSFPSLPGKVKLYGHSSVVEVQLGSQVSSVTRVCHRIRDATHVFKLPDRADDALIVFQIMDLEIIHKSESLSRIIRDQMVTKSPGRDESR